MDIGVSHREKLLGNPGLGLQGDDLLHGLAGSGAGQQQGFIAALKQNLAAVFPGQRPHIDDLVGDGDHIPVVLHHQHGVALVPEVFQKPGHPVHIPGVHTSAGLVKDIDHSRQGAAHVPHQLQPLRLAAGEGGGFPIHGQVGKADVNHPVQGGGEGLHDGGGSGVGDGAEHLHQLGEFHGAHLVDAVACHLAGQGSGIQPPPAAVGADLFLHELIQLFQGVVVLLLGAFHQAKPLELGFDALHPFVFPGAAGLPAAIEQQIPLLGTVVPVFFVQIKKTGAGVLLPVVVAHPEGRQVQHTLVPGFVRVDGAFNVQIQNFADAGAGFAHPVGVVEGEAGGGAGIGLPNSGVQQPQGGVHIADGAHGGTGVAPQPGLIHDDGGAEVVDALHLRLFKLGQPAPDEGGVGFVHLPLALGGDGVKDDAGFSGAGHPGKHHDFSLGNVQRHIFQVVLPEPPDEDGIGLHKVPSLSL